MATASDTKAKAAEFVGKRGRPTSAQVAAIKQSILTVAREMFLANGYANTSMEAVAASAGVSKGTLYARYSDKSDLFNDIVSDRLAVWEKAAPRDALANDGTVPDFLFRFALSFLNNMRVPEIAAFHRLLAAEAERFPELAREFYRRGYVQAVARLAGGIEALAGQSGWHLSDPKGMASAFMSALMGWFGSEILLHPLNEDDCANYAARLAEIFVGGRSAW